MDANKNEYWAATLAGAPVDEQAEALRQISAQPSVKGLTVAVVGLAGSRDDEVRMWSAEALEASIQPQADEVDGLIELLERAGDGEICYWAATMLGRLGSDAVAAVAPLERCLRDSMFLAARERAAWGLAEIGPAAAAALPTLRIAADNGPPRLRRLACHAIESITRDAGGEEIAA